MMKEEIKLKKIPENRTMLCSCGTGSDKTFFVRFLNYRGRECEVEFDGYTKKEMKQELKDWNKELDLKDSFDRDWYIKKILGIYIGEECDHRYCPKCHGHGYMLKKMEE